MRHHPIVHMSDDALAREISRIDSKIAGLLNEVEAQDGRQSLLQGTGYHAMMRYATLLRAERQCRLTLQMIDQLSRVSA